MNAIFSIGYVDACVSLVSEQSWDLTILGMDHEERCLTLKFRNGIYALRIQVYGDKRAELD